MAGAAHPVHGFVHCICKLEVILCLVDTIRFVGGPVWPDLFFLADPRSIPLCLRHSASSSGQFLTRNTYGTKRDAVAVTKRGIVVNVRVVFPDFVRGVGVLHFCGAQILQYKFELRRFIDAWIPSTLEDPPGA